MTTLRRLAPLLLGCVICAAGPALAEPNPPAKRHTRSDAEHIGLHVDATWYGIGAGLYLGYRIGDAADDLSGGATGAIAGMVVTPILFNGLYGMLDHRRPLPYTLPRSISAGMRVGLLAALPTAVLIEEADDGEANLDRVAGVLLGLPAVGGLAGGLLWQAFEPNYVTVRAVEAGALWGSLVGSSVGAAVEPDTTSSVAAPMLGFSSGLALGAVAGGAMAAAFQPRQAVITGVHVGALGGSMVAGTIVQTWAPEGDSNKRAIALVQGAGILAGAAVGGWVVSRWGKGSDEPTAQWRLLPTRDGVYAVGSF